MRSVAKQDYEELKLAHLQLRQVVRALLDYGCDPCEIEASSLHSCFWLRQGVNAKIHACLADPLDVPCVARNARSSSFRSQKYCVCHASRF